MFGYTFGIYEHDCHWLSNEGYNNPGILSLVYLMFYQIDGVNLNRYQYKVRMNFISRILINPTLSSLCLQEVQCNEIYFFLINLNRLSVF